MYCVFIIHPKLFSDLPLFPFDQPSILRWCLIFTLFVNFPNFLLLLISNFILLWPENTLYDFNYMIFLGEKQNDRESKNIYGHQELGKRGCWTGEARGIFQGGETSLYDTMIHDTRYLQTYWTLRHNFNVCKYLKNHLGSGGKPRMECRMWVNNLTIL